MQTLFSSFGKMHKFFKGNCQIKGRQLGRSAVQTQRRQLAKPLYKPPSKRAPPSSVKTLQSITRVESSLRVWSSSELASPALQSSSSRFDKSLLLKAKILPFTNLGWITKASGRQMTFNDHRGLGSPEGHAMDEPSRSPWRLNAVARPSYGEPSRSPVPTAHPQGSLSNHCW